MREFLVLISQILIIFTIQQLSEMVFDEKKLHSRIISIVCFAGSFYLVLNYVYTYILGELVAAFQFVF